MEYKCILGKSLVKQMEEEKKEMAAKAKARSAVEAKADKTYQKTVSALKKLKEKHTEKMAALVKEESELFNHRPPPAKRSRGNDLWDDAQGAAPFFPPYTPTVGRSIDFTAEGLVSTTPLSAKQP